MTTKFTPGDWYAKGAAVFVGPDCIALTDTDNATPERYDANARLMAAAPTMLDALREADLQLQYLAEKFGETGTGAAVQARVRAAIEIAIAEGVGS